MKTTSGNGYKVIPIYPPPLFGLLLELREAGISAARWVSATSGGGSHQRYTWSLQTPALGPFGPLRYTLPFTSVPSPGVMTITISESGTSLFQRGEGPVVKYDVLRFHFRCCGKRC